MTAPQHSDDRTRQHLDFLLSTIDAAGFTLDQLVEFAGDGSFSRGPTVGAYLDDDVKKAFSAQQFKVYQPYIDLLRDGYRGLCACMCDGCIEHVNGVGKFTPCDCVTRGECDCPKRTLEEKPLAAESCLETFHGLGDQPFCDVSAAQWQQAVSWAQLKAVKRARVRARSREAAGRPAHDHHGASAAEHTRAVILKAYKLARNDPKMKLTVDPSEAVTKPKRMTPKRAGYTKQQLEELWAAIFTSGGIDADLDMLLVWFLLETGARRSGATELKVGHLLLDTQGIRLKEKQEASADQPCSQALLASLLHHAITRGGVARSDSGEAVYDATIEDVRERRVRLATDAPVFYLRRVRHLDDGSTRPWPLSERHFQTMFQRLQLALPWLDEIHGRPHDLRRTGATFIERCFGHAVAKGWLRHEDSSPTDTYVTASAADIAQAARWWWGEVDPDDAGRHG